MYFHKIPSVLFLERVRVTSKNVGKCFYKNVFYYQKYYRKLRFMIVVSFFYVCDIVFCILKMQSFCNPSLIQTDFLSV